MEFFSGAILTTHKSNLKVKTESITAQNLGYVAEEDNIINSRYSNSQINLLYIHK